MLKPIVKAPSISPGGGGHGEEHVIFYKLSFRSKKIAVSNKSSLE